MDEEFYAMVERSFDELRMKIAAIEDALVKLPFINMEADPSRPQVIKVDPAGLVVPE